MPKSRKKYGQVRPRIPFSLLDMDPEPVAEAYNKIMARGPYPFYARQILNLGVQAGKVLDIACGPGNLLASLASRAPHLELHGLDISPNMIKIAQRNLASKQLGDKVQFHVGSAYQLPFDNNTFDLVVNSQTLHCLEDLTSFFTEITRVLKTGGQGLVFAFRRDVPALLSRLGYAHTKYLAWRRIPLDGLGAVLDASYTPDEIEDSLAQCQLTELDIKCGRALLTVFLKK